MLAKEEEKLSPRLSLEGGGGDIHTEKGWLLGWAVVSGYVQRSTSCEVAAGESENKRIITLE